MAYTVRMNDKRWRLPATLAAVILVLVLAVWGMSPGTAHSAAISCGDCHSIPPSDSDNTCPTAVAKNHLVHASVQADCVRCHIAAGSTAPTATHNNGFVEITSVLAPGLAYNTGTCTDACHMNEDATWGGTLDCNACHYRSGAFGNMSMSGLHIAADRSWKHYSSPIKVNGQSITCVNCHPDNESDTSTPRAHITPSTIDARANLSNAHADVTVSGIGYSKGATPGDGTCTGSCHYNATDSYGNYTIYFKPGQKRYFGPYQSRSWGDADLNCNECHSTPSEQALFGHATSFASLNANSRHEAHMFRYKLNPYNFMSEDRNIYCDDCHRTPDINTSRGFQHHSTLGAGGSGVISLPLQADTARVYLLWRNGGTGRDGINPPSYDYGTTTCDNVYCHTIMVSGSWTEEACNACHGVNDGVGVGNGAPGYRNWTTPATYPAFEEYSGGGGAHYSHVMRRGYPCRTCHYDGGGDGNPANHAQGGRTVLRTNVNVGVHPDYWFNNKTSFYDLTTRSCNNVRCHYGSSQNWDCEPLH